MQKLWVIEKCEKSIAPQHAFLFADVRLGKNSNEHCIHSAADTVTASRYYSRVFPVYVNTSA